MQKDNERIYKIRKTDIPKTGIILANAFKQDPVWKEVFKDIGTNKIQSFFEGPARYGIKYGKARATTENLEGIAVWVPGTNAEMTLWRGICSGSMISGMKVGMKALLKMKTIFEPLETDRKNRMKGRDYIYLMVLGVDPEFQKQRFGSKLLNAIIDESEKNMIPIYLETSTERNVTMYQKFGFKVLNKMIHPIIELPQWKMLREPGTNKHN